MWSPEDSAQGLRCWPLPARGLAPAAAGKCQQQRCGVGTEVASPHWALPTGDERRMGTEEEKCCCSVSGLCNSLIMFFYVYVQDAWQRSCLLKQENYKSTSGKRKPTSHKMAIGGDV